MFNNALHVGYRVRDMVLCTGSESYCCSSQMENGYSCLHRRLLYQLVSAIYPWPLHWTAPITHACLYEYNIGDRSYLCNNATIEQNTAKLVVSTYKTLSLNFCKVKMMSLVCQGIFRLVPFMITNFTFKNSTIYIIYIELSDKQYQADQEHFTLSFNSSRQLSRKYILS